MNSFKTFLTNTRDRQRINIGLNKGIASKSCRKLNPKDPISWEYSGFSQNGEDGIIEFLLENLIETNHYFIEIGSADGIDCNSLWHIITKKYGGIQIEASSKLSSTAKRMTGHFAHNLKFKAKYVTVENISNLLSDSWFQDPDFLSVDVDSIDFYLIKEIFNLHYRPKIVIVEYNSVFGPSISATVNYEEALSYPSDGSPENYYYGASIQGWKNFFTEFGYKFITVDSNGVNAFFVNPSCFREEFLSDLKGIEFAKNKLAEGYFRSSFEKASLKLSKLNIENI